MLKKVWKITKQVTQVALVILFSFGVSFGIYKSVMENNKLPSHAEMSSLDNVSGDLSYDERRAVDLSRHSILQVLSSYGNGEGFAKMSGTYVKYNDRFYVITAAHGIASDCDRLYVSAEDDELYECIQYVIVDKFVDYAIIEIEEVRDRQAIDLHRATPRNNEWPGSSGSGVFSHEGNMIGIIIALNVGWTAAGFDVLEDLVIVTPLFMIDWDTAYEIMDATPPEGDTGDTGQ
jgi:hypothetical protein